MGNFDFFTSIADMNGDNTDLVPVWDFEDEGYLAWNLEGELSSFDVNHEALEEFWAMQSEPWTVNWL